MHKHSRSYVATNREKYEIAAGHPEAAQRLMRRVSVEDGCWYWQGSSNGRGYGTLTVGKQCVYAHRLSFWLFKGEPVEGLVIDHLCANPRCVRPSHLEAVSAQTNTLRGKRGGKLLCPQGHPYSGENLRTHTDKNGYVRRYCVICVNHRNATRSLKAA